MKKIINELMEMHEEGIKEALIIYNKKWELSIGLLCQADCIPKCHQLGIIDLEIYNSYEDIKEEIEYLLD